MVRLCEHVQCPCTCTVSSTSDIIFNQSIDAITNHNQLVKDVWPYRSPSHMWRTPAVTGTHFRWADWTQRAKQVFCRGRDLNLGPFGRQTSIITANLPPLYDIRVTVVWLNTPRYVTFVPWWLKRVISFSAPANGEYVTRVISAPVIEGAFPSIKRHVDLVAIDGANRRWTHQLGVLTVDCFQFHPDLEVVRLWRRWFLKQEWVTCHDLFD